MASRALLILKFLAALVDSHWKTTMPVYLLLSGCLEGLKGAFKLFEMTVFGAG